VDQLDTWLSEQIEAHTPEREQDPAAAARIVEAYAALAGAKAPAFGMQELPAEIANRDQLRARALEVLKLWLAQVDAETKDKLRAQLAGYGIGSGPPVPPAPPDDGA
jgi:anti-sigma factor RsiW